MIWLFILGAVVAVVLLAVLTGLKPDSARTVSGTRLMTIAKIVLFFIALLFVIMALR